MRVLITGMGGELGTAVARLLEADPAVDTLVGVDLYPPRRRLHRAEFHRIDPRNRERVHRVVADYAPTVLVHLGVYEPYSRSSPTSAVERTATGTVATLDAAVDGGALEHVVMRSGIEVYGRRRGAPMRPDEQAPTDPSCAFGHSLLHAERVGREAGLRAAMPVTALRFAAIVGPHVPSPLGRLLRLPAVPFRALADPAFSVVHQDDVADAFVAAVHRPFDGPVNVVGPGAMTALQAALVGRRIPVPVVGPTWRFTRAVAQVAGSPVPDHVQELLRRGRTADGSHAIDAIGFRPANRTADVVRHLFEWSEVAYVTGLSQEAA